MSRMQKAAVQQAKIDNGWKDSCTPPDGFTVNSDGNAIPSPSIVAAIQSQMNIRQFQQVQTHGAGTPLPPPSPPAAPPIPGTITTNNAGQAFGLSASRGGNGDASSVISMVNGRSYSGHVYDANAWYETWYRLLGRYKLCWKTCLCRGVEFVVDKFVTAGGFSASLGTIPDSPIANVLYAYDNDDSKTYIIECNNSIYLGDRMDDSLMNPIQAEESDVRVDTRPRRYYSDPHAQTISFPCCTVLPVEYDGGLPFIPIRRPTADEIHSCQRLVMSAKFPWDPSIPGGFFSQPRSVFSTSSSILDSVQDDPVGSSLMGRTPYEMIMHYTPDISEYVSFGWFQWCYYFDEDSKSKKICRWLGPAHEVGQSFCHWVLLSNGNYIARSSVIPIPDHELESDDMKRRRNVFMDCIHEKIGNTKEPIYNNIYPQRIYYDAFEDPIKDDECQLPYGAELHEAKLENVDDKYLEALDNYINAKVVVPDKDGIPVLTKVKSRKRDAAGNPVGDANENPILDTRVYDLEFPDGRVEEYSVNMIAENLFEQADEHGWDSGIIEEFLDIRKDDSIAVPKERGMYFNNAGVERNIVTTKGWEVQVKWRDKSTSWISLKNVKEGDPLGLAELAVVLKVQDEPAFKWWVNLGFVKFSSENH
ncbi:hypothetical protein CTEN210_18251 [Chaetoceros tenuissimus]|uniref:Uncharacterized protein n=1 Tax=Chaetoceros tenuissimus TaxID=426638 RepID=A0AAD3HFI9_9STRA|nr:hypothetical protein CTEN210_18251 [Chaetoceros tenuissimus]